MKRFYLIVILSWICIFQSNVFALWVNDSKWSFGIFAGANANRITELPNMIVPETYYTDYTFDSKYCFGFTGGIFFNYRPYHLFGIQPEVSYAMQYGKLRYADVNDLNYDLDFKYNYLNAGIGIKLYPWSNLFLSVTPQVGFNLTPDNLFYSSNREDLYGSDSETQQLMRNVIKGRINVSLGFGLGYQFANRIYVDARYYLGISDMIETLNNSYRFVDTGNKSNVFQLTVGYAFSIK